VGVERRSGERRERSMAAWIGCAALVGSMRTADGSMDFGRMIWGGVMVMDDGRKAEMAGHVIPNRTSRFTTASVRVTIISDLQRNLKSENFVLRIIKNTPYRGLHFKIWISSAFSIF